MAVKAEQLAAAALVDWLRWQLPAKVTAVNATRAAVLKATTPGPYTLPLMGLLILSKTSRESGTTVFVGSGSTTATALAAAINGTIPGFASVDSDDRLVLTGDAPSGSTPSLVSAFAASGSNNANSVLGWEAGGEHVLNAALVSPGWRGLADGFPQALDMGPGFLVVVGDRSSVPLSPDPRKDEYLVTLDVWLYYPPRQQETHRNREPVHSMVRCVRECLLTDAGRQFGRASVGDIMFVREKSCRIAGKPWKVATKDANINPIYDVANLQLEVRVFERPSAS